MARYMSNWGERYEFEAKNSDEIISCFKKIFNQESASDETLLQKLKSMALSWSGANLNVMCNRSFVKSLKDSGYLINLSNQCEKERTALLSRWSETGFGEIDYGR